MNALIPGDKSSAADLCPSGTASGNSCIDTNQERIRLEMTFKYRTTSNYTLPHKAEPGVHTANKHDDSNPLFELKPILLLMSRSIRNVLRIPPWEPMKVVFENDVLYMVIRRAYTAVVAGMV